jgi:PTH1 family peptidyl-tRNA hydrolase
MKLIVGLGNPGRAYSKHRHNIGFAIVDELAGRHHIAISKKAFEAKIGEGKVVNVKAILAKPQIFMNLSGRAVAPLMGYFRCSLEDVIVIHDDIDLAVGRLKFGLGSGHGGHNGIRSIIEELGSPDFYRVRVGVGRPPVDVDPADYVLHPFRKEERRQIQEVIVQTATAVEELITEGLQFVQQKYH